MRRPGLGRHTPWRQAGVSLVELMVGLAVGMMVVAGMALMFANASRSAAELEKSMRHIENARHALDLLAEDLSMAGYFGTAAASGFADSDSPCAAAGVLAASLNATHAAGSPTTLPLPLRGYTASEAAALGCLPADWKTGTPVMVLRRLDTTPLAASAAPVGALVLQASHFMDDVAPFMATASGTGLVLRDRLGNPNLVRRFLVRIYYLARCSECAGTGDGIPTLKRLELRDSGMVSVPLAEGIEQVAFDYGFDTSGDGVPDQWLGLAGASGLAESQATALAGWGNVVAARLTVLSRSTEATPGYLDARSYNLGLQGSTPYLVPASSDAFKRRVGTTTVRLQSVAGLRETP